MGINKRMILEEMFSETETDEHEFFMDDDEDDANFEEKMEDGAIEQSIEDAWIEEDMKRQEAGIPRNRYHG